MKKIKKCIEFMQSDFFKSLRAIDWTFELQQKEEKESEVDKEREGDRKSVCLCVYMERERVIW